MASSSTNPWPLKRGRSASLRASSPAGGDPEPPKKKGKGKATETVAEEVEPSGSQWGLDFKWENVRFGSLPAKYSVSVAVLLSS